MNEQVLKILLQAKDLASGEIEKVKKAIDKVAGASSEAGKKNKFFEDSLKNITNVAKTGAVVVGGLAVAVSGYGLNLATSFESQLSSIQALTGSTSEQMKSISALALQVGKETKYSALESAQGIEELLKAGVSLEAVLGGGLKGALDLATAGGLELADAAEIASTALNAFKNDNLTVAEAGNILAGAANASATSVMELKFGLSQASAVVSAVGMSFKDTNTALALFAQNGLKGSDAGTSLKTMFLNLQPQSKKQMQLFEDLGLATIKWELGAKGAKKEGVAMTNAFFTAEGKVKSLAEVSDVLKNALKDQTDQQRLASLETLFGSDAIRAGNILYKEGSEGATKMAEAMSKVTASQVAEEKMNNLAGAIERLKGSFETLLIEAFTPFLPALTFLATHLDNIVGSASASAFSQQLISIATVMANDLKPIVDDFLKNIWPVWEVRLQRIWEQMKVWLIPALQMLWSVFVNDLLPALINAIGTFLWLWDAVSPLIGLIGTLLVGAFGLIVSAIGLVIQNLTLIGKAAVQILTGDFKGAIDTVKKAWDNFIGFFTGGYGKISKMIGDIRGNMSNLKLPEFKIPGRASGGNVTAGQVYAVGENRDGSFNKTTELFVPNTSGKILNAKDTQAMVSGGGGNSGGGNTNNQNIVININAQGALLDDRTISEFARRTKNIFKAQGFQIS